MFLTVRVDADRNGTENIALSRPINLEYKSKYRTGRSGSGRK